MTQPPPPSVKHHPVTGVTLSHKQSKRVKFYSPALSITAKDFADSDCDSDDHFQ